jgi:hypothetical protein
MILTRVGDTGLFMSITDMTIHITDPQVTDHPQDKGLQGWGALPVVDLLAQGDRHARPQGQCRADRIQLVARLLKEA